MSRSSSPAYRFWRRIRRLLARLFSFTRRGHFPFRAFREPDILDVTPDGVVQITRTSGPIPLRPRVVANSDFTNPRTQRLARRAAIFLFEYFDFGTVPAQFWPVFEKTYDPAISMDDFLRAVGCDPLRVRRKDPIETSKARDVIELLVRS